MPISITDMFNLDKRAFANTGAFDTILDVDSRVFIDPALLDSCEIPEFSDSSKIVENYFAGIIRLLSASNEEDDIFWKKANKCLKFKELTGTCFGYTKKGTNGNSIGDKLRREILRNIKSLICAGEKDPTIFELLGAFQEGIGCDRISDLITFILSDNILMFSQRIFETFRLAHDFTTYNKKSYRTVLNPFSQKPILLIPEIMLSPLPVAESFYDISDACSINDRVRDDINSLLEFKQGARLTKRDILELMLKFPEFREKLLLDYKEFSFSPYDFVHDSVGEYVWYRVSREYTAKHPLELKLPSTPTTEDLYVLVEKICTNFKILIEDNGLSSLLYDDDHKPKRERAAQLLFYGIADAYCTANNIDLSRECNAGHGSVDFKLSHGSRIKIVVEIKLTSNPQLKHGFEVQVPKYMQQEHTEHAIYLIIDNGHPKVLDNFIKQYNSTAQSSKEKIKCILVNGNIQPSASIA